MNMAQERVKGGRKASRNGKRGASYPGRLFRAHSQNPVQYAPGISRETLGYGRDGLIARFTLHKGFQIPLHQHPNEQISYVIKGKSMVRIGSQTVMVQAGDTFVVPPSAFHGQLALEETVTLVSWSPVRREYADVRFQSIGAAKEEARPGARNPKNPPR